jgi:hypothetical protein
MEKTTKVKEIREFQFGANKEKTGYNIIAEDDTQFTTFSSTIATEFKTAIEDKKERKFEYTEKPNSNPSYPPMRTIGKVWDGEGKEMESSKATGGGRVAKADPVKTASIERQNAMNSAVRLYAEFKPDGDKINIDELMSYAETILLWTSKKGE